MVQKGQRIKSRDLPELTFHITTMASPIGYQLSLEDSDFIDTWLRCFAASARTKKLKDHKKKGGENEITDFFLATAGCEAIVKVPNMAYLSNLEDLMNLCARLTLVSG